MVSSDAPVEFLHVVLLYALFPEGLCEICFVPDRLGGTTAASSPLCCCFSEECPYVSKDSLKAC